MIDHERLHQEYVEAGLSVAGVNEDGSINFREFSPQVRKLVEANRPNMKGRKESGLSKEELDALRMADWVASIPEVDEVMIKIADEVLASHKNKAEAANESDRR